MKLRHRHHKILLTLFMVVAVSVLRFGVDTPEEIVPFIPLVVVFILVVVGIEFAFKSSGMK